MGTVRIIAGSLRGRRVRVVDRPGLRPTSDRVRESLFNLLGQRLDGQEVLDLYAGSGALGLESLSRGAVRVVFVEADSRTRLVLRENIRVLGVESRAKVVSGDALDAIGQGTLGTFDLVLADPPYDLGVATDLPQRLERAGVVKDGGTVVLEQDARSPTPRWPEGWTLHREARYGRTVLRLYRRDSAKSTET